VAEIKEVERSTNEKRIELNSQAEMIKGLLEAKDSEIELLKRSEEDLKGQVDKLNEMLEEQWKDYQRLKIVPEDELKQA